MSAPPVRTGARGAPDAAAAKLAYAALFTVLLPLSLAAWAARLDELVPLPAYDAPLAGLVLATSGIALMSAASAALWIHAHGLPMSPYPPARYVSRGPYHVIRNPIYAGAVLTAAGISLGTGSAAGLWIVTPVLAASTAAWVIGFEGDATRARFGGALPAPLLRLAPATDDAPTTSERVSVFVLLLLPWLVLYEAVELLGVPPDAVIAWQPWDAALPVLAWTEPVYALAYPLVLLAPIVARTQRDLRTFMLRGWLAMALILPLYLLLPVVAPAKPVMGSGVLASMLRWERAFDRPVTAFPAYHVVWTLLAVAVFQRRWPGLRGLWWAIAVAIATSCVTTGMHASADVAGGAIAFGLVIGAGRIWASIRRATEHVANSWREVTIGPVRLLGHGVYAALGIWIGCLVIVSLAGDDAVGSALAAAGATVVGAALWAQTVEGSPQLLRPFGYYGGVIGAVVALVVIGAVGGDAWRLLAAFAIGGSLAQAIGRGRCLVQGCCHGAECPAWLGIRFRHPRSRVTRLSELGGRPVHPTQLYSLGWMLFVAAVLFRLWTLHAGLEFIVGAYFLLTGLGRFVEEHFRGEPQTVVWRGLRLYQWLALAFVVLGGAIMCAGWRPAPSPELPSATSVWWITAFALLSYVAYGVDFPRLRARFSRLV